APRNGANPADVPLLRYPTTGIAGCCALAASGHAAMAPDRTMMKSRRRMRLPGSTDEAYHTSAKCRLGVTNSDMTLTFHSAAIRPGADWVARTSQNMCAIAVSVRRAPRR